MNLFLIILSVVLAVACAVAVTLLMAQRRRAEQLERDNMAAVESAGARIAAAEARVAAAEQAREAERAAREAERVARAKAEADLEAERRSVADKVRSQQQMEQALREQFRALAGDVLGEQSRRFKEENRESMDIILKPFKDNIREFRERVEKIHSQQAEQSGALRNELERLMELNRQVTAETTNLTNALKGNSKVQGDWGEMILAQLLENSGLREGENYELQYNVKDEASGRNLRPDVILHLPGGKNIVIDSKVSLTAFERYVNADDDAARDAALKRHIESVRHHVDELATKNYQQYFADSPDFVIMFMPTEPSFLTALRGDDSLWNYAYGRKVIISSPTNLFAVLKLVVDLWKRDAQDRNTAKIVKTATDLYNQLCMFVDDFEKVGKSIEKATADYAQAYKRMCHGNNNVIRLGERMRGMGLRPKKRISDKALDEAALPTGDDDEQLLAETIGEEGGNE